MKSILEFLINNHINKPANAIKLTTELNMLAKDDYFAYQWESAGHVEHTYLIKCKKIDHQFVIPYWTFKISSDATKLFVDFDMEAQTNLNNIKEKNYKIFTSKDMDILFNNWELIVNKIEEFYDKNCASFNMGDESLEYSINPKTLQFKFVPEYE